MKSKPRANDDAQEEVSTQSPAPSMEIDSTPPTAPEVDAAVPETRLLIIGECALRFLVWALQASKP